MGVGFAVVTAFCIPVYIFAPEIVSLIHNSPLVLDVGVPALRYATIGLLFVPIFTPINMLYQSIRKALIASVLSLMRSGLTFIPVLLITTHFWGILGIQISQPIADVITGIISIPFLIYFLKLSSKLTAAQKNNKLQTAENTEDDR